MITHWLKYRERCLQTLAERLAKVKFQTLGKTLLEVYCKNLMQLLADRLAVVNFETL